MFLIKEKVILKDKKFTFQPPINIVHSIISLFLKHLLSNRVRIIHIFNMFRENKDLCFDGMMLCIFFFFNKTVVETSFVDEQSMKMIISVFTNVDCLSTIYNFVNKLLNNGQWMLSSFIYFSVVQLLSQSIFPVGLLRFISHTKSLRTI